MDVFLDVLPKEDERDREVTPSGSEGGEEEEIAQLQSALHEAQSLNKALQDKVCLLKSQLENERKKEKEMWYKNCDHLHEFDEILAAKDEEIESLSGSHRGVASDEHGRVSCRGRRYPQRGHIGKKHHQWMSLQVRDNREQRPGMAGLSKST